jgi:uncharacterized membrane protein YedE/YeeE
VKSVLVLLAGVLFGSGLAISQMTNPNKVLSFLDIFGDWDPSLAFVMGAALAVSSLAYAVARRREAPFLGDEFHLPKNSGIDRRLVAGAILFGIGWGLGGFCPGPAIAALVTGKVPVVIFVCAMVAGMVAFRCAGWAGANGKQPDSSMEGGRG